MTAIFPASGVSASDALNSLLDPDLKSCDALWHSTSRCQPRFDPAAANAMMSELINAVNCGGIPYDCTKLDNLCEAIARTIQNGDANCLVLSGGTTEYYGDLHPPLLAYPPDCCMLLKVIPNVSNTSAVRLNVNGLGPKPVVRNDGQPLESLDWRGGMPTLIVYCNGQFVVPNLCPSQVPIIVKGGIDVWIRTDGNDLSGDGSMNTPERAYRTIMGAWNGVGSRYAATPLFSINMKFGIPGDYEGAIIGPFGGTVTLTGDMNNPAGYRIHGMYDRGSCSFCLWCQGMNSFIGYGFTVYMDIVDDLTTMAFRSVASGTILVNCRFEAALNNVRAGMLECTHGGRFSGHNVGNPITNLWFVGNGHTIYCLFAVSEGGGFIGAILAIGQTLNYYFNDFNLAGPAIAMGGLGNAHLTMTNMFNTNVVGSQYSVQENSILNAVGHAIPGTLAGAVGSGGQFIP